MNNWIDPSDQKGFLERSLLIPAVCGLSPDIGKIYTEHCLLSSVANLINNLRS